MTEIQSTIITASFFDEKEGITNVFCLKQHQGFNSDFPTVSLVPVAKVFENNKELLVFENEQKADEFIDYVSKTMPYFDTNATGIEKTEALNMLKPTQIVTKLDI